MIWCSCERLSEQFIRKAIIERADAVRAETTDNRAAAIVWRATHPVPEDGHRERHCGTCMEHIREAIREMGLRGTDENPCGAPRNKCGTSGVSCGAPCLSR